MTTPIDEFQHILAIHPNPIVVHVNFKPLYCNDAFARFSGLKSAKQILELDSLMVLINKEEREDAKVRYRQAIEQKYTPAKVIAHTDLQGNPVMVEITDKPIMWQDTLALCTFISIVTDTVKKERQLKELSERDELTQLHNRRYIISVLNKIRKNEIQDDYYLAILDIDFFKKVNDQYGHLAGDIVLKNFANTLQGFVGEHDELARLGGEEFVLLLKSRGAENIHARMESLRSTVETQHFLIRSPDNTQTTRIRITCSIGICKIKANDKIDKLYRRSDQALYQAKQTGRNRVVMLNE